MTQATQATNPLVQTGLATLAFSRGVTMKLLEAIPAESRLVCPIEGAHHVMWIAGHVAMTDDYFLKAVGGQESVIDESWEKLFGMGSTACEDASVYPSWDEIVATMIERRGALEAWFATLDADALAAPLPEEIQFFAPSVGALMGSVAWHEGFHAGQTTAIRKKLGLESVLG
jgi:uncharacterized damage-inducible protein DinB